MTKNADPDAWETGASDPADFTADAVKAVLDRSDDTERDRILAADDRATVQDAPAPTPPTAPSAETLAAYPDAAPSVTAPDAVDPDALKPGDDAAELAPHGDDGYDRVVVSIG